jgi:hypothetical protein
MWQARRMNARYKPKAPEGSKKKVMDYSKN